MIWYVENMNDVILQNQIIDKHNKAKTVLNILLQYNAIIRLVTNPLLAKMYELFLKSFISCLLIMINMIFCLKLAFS